MNRMLVVGMLAAAALATPSWAMSRAKERAANAEKAVRPEKAVSPAKVAKGLGALKNAVGKKLRDVADRTKRIILESAQLDTSTVDREGNRIATATILVRNSVLKNGESPKMGYEWGFQDSFQGRMEQPWTVVDTTRPLEQGEVKKGYTKYNVRMVLNGATLEGGDTTSLEKLQVRFIPFIELKTRRVFDHNFKPNEDSGDPNHNYVLNWRLNRNAFQAPVDPAAAKPRRASAAAQRPSPRAIVRRIINRDVADHDKKVVLESAHFPGQGVDSEGNRLATATVLVQDDLIKDGEVPTVGYAWGFQKNETSVDTRQPWTLQGMVRAPEQEQQGAPSGYSRFKVSVALKDLKEGTLSQTGAESLQISLIALVQQNDGTTLYDHNFPGNNNDHNPHGNTILNWHLNQNDFKWSPFLQHHQ